MGIFVGFSLALLGHLASVIAVVRILLYPVWRYSRCFLDSSSANKDLSLSLYFKPFLCQLSRYRFNHSVLGREHWNRQRHPLPTSSVSQHRPSTSLNVVIQVVNGCQHVILPHLASIEVNLSCIAKSGNFLVTCQRQLRALAMMVYLKHSLAHQADCISWRPCAPQFPSTPPVVLELPGD